MKYLISKWNRFVIATVTIRNSTWIMSRGACSTFFLCRSTWSESKWNFEMFSNSVFWHCHRFSMYWKRILNAVFLFICDVLPKFFNLSSEKSGIMITNNILCLLIIWKSLSTRITYRLHATVVFPSENRNYENISWHFHFSNEFL